MDDSSRATLQIRKKFVKNFFPASELRFFQLQNEKKKKKKKYAFNPLSASCRIHWL